MVKYDSNNSVNSQSVVRICSADSNIIAALLTHYHYLATMAEADVPGGGGRDLYVGKSQSELDSFKYGGLLQRWSCSINYGGSHRVLEYFFLRFSSSGGVR